MYIDLLILSQLMQGPKHGYEIKKDAEKILGNIYSINNNSLYPILKQFEDMGAISKHIEVQEGKPNRHVYSITPIGREILIDLIRDYPGDTAFCDYEFYTRVGLFGLIEKDDRRAILEKRKRALTEMKSHFDGIVSRKAESTDKRRIYGWQVMDMLKRQKQIESDWIDSIIAAEESSNEK